MIELSCSGQVDWPVFWRFKKIRELPSLRFQRLVARGPIPRWIDADGSLATFSSERENIALAQDGLWKNELSQKLTLATADHQEIDTVSCIERLNRPISSSLPKSDELPDFRRRNLRNPEYQSLPIHIDGAGPVFSTLRFDLRFGSFKPALSVDEFLSHQEIPVNSCIEFTQEAVPLYQCAPASLSSS